MICHVINLFVYLNIVAKMSRKNKNHPEKTWPTQSARAELAAITVAKRACDWATEVTWTVSHTA